MSKHRAESPQGPLPLVGAFALIVVLVIGLFAWASSAPDVAVAHDDGLTSAAMGVAAAIPEIDRPYAQRPVKLQRGMKVDRVKPVCSRKPVSERITVLAYNMKSARVSSLGAIAGVIRSSGADVVLLQEVDRNRYPTRVDQPAWLASNLGGWAHAFGENVDYGGTRGYGTAILSRWPIVSSDNSPLPNARGGQRRGLLKAVVDIEGVHVSFYSTHLQPNMTALRIRQAGTVARIVGGDRNPRVLGGDMNAWPTSRSIGILRSRITDTWAVVGAGKGATHPARGPRTRIDFLMHGGSGLTPVSAAVLGSLASDHRAVRATYDLSGFTEKVCTTPTPDALKR